MYNNRKLLAIIILTASIFCILSCAPAEKAAALDVLKPAADFKVEGERNGIGFCASVSLGEMREDGTRSGEIVYSLPDAFAGLRIRSDSGVWEAEQGGVTVSGAAAESLGAPLAPFMQRGSAGSAESITSENGEARTLIKVPSESGNLEFTVDSKSGLPVFLTEKNSAGETVMEFKITEYKTQKTN